MEDAPNYNPEDPFADKVALTDHRHYLLGQHFIKEGRVRVSPPWPTVGRLLAILGICSPR